MPPCETLSHTVLDLTEVTEDTEGGRKRVEKSLFETMPLTEITKDTERGADKSLKNLCALCASVRNSYPIPFLDLTEITEDMEGGRKSVEKSLFETMPLTEITKNAEREANKSLKKPLCPLCLCAKLLSHTVLDLTEVTKDTERGADKSLKNLCGLCASVRNSIPYHFQISRRSQRTRRGIRQRQKTSVHSVPPCETLYTSHAVLALTEITEDTEGGRKSVEKPLFETMPLTEST